MIQLIEATDTPKQGIEKINSNFVLLEDELDGKISSDGTTGMEGPFDFGGYKGIQLAPATEDTDALNLSQAISLSNQLVVRKYIYVIPDTNQSPKLLYIDGTSSDYAIKVDSVQSALKFINSEGGSQDEDRYTIHIPFKNDNYSDQSFVDFGDYINIVGDGRPVIEVSDGTTSGVADIIGDSRIANCTIIYNQGKVLNLENLTLHDCDIFMSNLVGMDPRVLTLRSVKITNSRLIADEIVIDGTTGNYLHNNIHTVQFTNEANNDPNTQNFENSNLANYYEIYPIT